MAYNFCGGHQTPNIESGFSKDYLKMHRRKQIDAAFVGMAGDADYQKQAILLAEEFERSDWEVLQLGESDLTGNQLAMPQILPLLKITLDLP